MTDDYARWIVTNDPEQLADLLVKSDELDTFGLAEYAMSLGLYPPGYTEGQRPSIEFAWPPGYEGPPLVMWSGYFPSVAPDDVADDDDEYDDFEVWGDIVGIEEVPTNSERGGSPDGPTEPGRGASGSSV